MIDKTTSSESKPSPLGFVGGTAQFFLENGKISMLVLLALVVWGVLSFIMMPKQYNPEIVLPAFTITADLPNASAEEVWELLTRKLEDGAAGLPKIDTISSQSFAGGKSVVLVQFLVGSSVSEATTALSQKMRDMQSILPMGASVPVMQSISPDDVPILDIGLTSNTLSESSLRELAIDISDELKRVPGISKAEVKGGRTNHLQVELDGKSLAEKNIALSEITNALASANGSFSIDALKTEGKNSIVSVSGTLQNADELSRVVIRQKNDTMLRLEDIARVSYGPGEITNFVRLSEKDASTGPVIHIALGKIKGENATVVSKNVIATLENLKGRLIPNDVTVSVLRDEGAIAGKEISKLTFDLVKSILIVGVLLMLFLGLRNSLIASISIPLVLLTVFGVGLLVGQTLNRITLFALILSLGLLVDDAIVVVENIARHKKLHPQENLLRLIVSAVDEVGGALALSTLTMALAFIPMAFVTGMMGPYMGPIPFFVPAALFASLVISVTLNPFLALVLTSKKRNSSPEKKNIFSRGFEKIEQIYERLLSLLLLHPKKRSAVLFGTLGLLLLAFVLPLTPLVPFRMLPKADKEQFYIYLDLVDNTALHTTDAVSQSLEKTLLADADILRVESFVGTSPVIDFNGLFKGSSGRVGENQATLRIDLTDPDERSLSSEEIASRVRSTLQLFQQTVPGVTLRIIEDPPGPPVLSTFLLKIKGGSDETREKIAQHFTAESMRTPGITDVDTSLPERGIDNTYQIDTEKAQAMGVSPKEAESALTTALSGSIVGLSRAVGDSAVRQAEQEYIILRFAKEDRDEEQDLSLVKIPNQTGALVSLAAFTTKTNRSVEKMIASDDRLKTTFVSAEMSDRSVIYAVLDLFPKFLHYTLPNEKGILSSWSPFGVTYTDTETGEQYRVEIGGEWKLTLEVFRDLGIVMGIVMILIFFVLAIRTKSLLVPSLIMTSIPLGLIGVLPGFAVLHLLKGTYFNATSMIGVIALAGLSVKNAIIYLEYLEPLRRAGKPIREALVEAGRIRLLPITLTSLAAILGSLTIVSDPVWEGLAWALIFGLSASTVLTLLIFPLLYFLFERKHWKEGEK